MYKPLLHVVGDVMLDVDLPGTVSRPSPEDPSVSIVHCERPAYHLGGAANVAALAAKAADVVLFGAVADDAHGQLIQSLCEQKHIDPFLDRSLNATTTKYRVFVDGLRVSRVDVERVQTVTGLIPATVSSRTTAIILSDYAKGVFSSAVGTEVQALITAATCPVVADVKPTDYLPIFFGATVIAPNERELVEIGSRLGIRNMDLIPTARKVGSALGCEAVVVTLGAGGAVCVTKTGYDFFPLGNCYDRPQVVGAGDAFVTALALEMGKGADVMEAVNVANASAHEYVGKERGE